MRPVSWRVIGKPRRFFNGGAPGNRRAVSVHRLLASAAGGAGPPQGVQRRAVALIYATLRAVFCWYRGCTPHRKHAMARSLTSTASPVAFAPPLIGSDEIAEVIATLESGWLTTGPRVAAFERAFAEYADAAHAIALNSCTAALHLSLLAAGVEAGDDVVTTPLTFCATANTIIHAGARPVFADVDVETGNLDPSTAAGAFTSRTRALLPVHFAGRPVD